MAWAARSPRFSISLFLINSVVFPVVTTLRIIGWIGMIMSVFNACIKLFADQHTLRQLAGSSRDLDLNISVVAFCLIFLALAAILEEVRK